LDSSDAASSPGPYSSRFENEWLVAILSILKIKRPRVYAALAKEGITADHFYKETQLDQLNLGGEQRFNWPWMRAHLDFYIMPEEELKKALTGQSEQSAELRQLASRWGGMPRRQMIPNLCSNLDRFSVKPE